MIEKYSNFKYTYLLIFVYAFRCYNLVKTYRIKLKYKIPLYIYTRII